VNFFMRSSKKHMDESDGSKQGDAKFGK